MIVYGSSMSPYVRKVLAFAAEKGLDFELKSLGLQADDPDFRAASPFGLMPAFRDGDFRLSDSTAIVTYMEAIKPDPALIPAEPRARAMTIWWDEIADTKFVPCMAKMFFNRIVCPLFLKQEGDLAEADRAEREDLPKLLDFLEPRVPESGYLVEDRLTLADIAIVQPFANFGHVGAGVDAARHPRVAAYVAEIQARPSIAPWIERERAFFAKVGYEPNR
ncbi:glutathione S-transferase family protein [Edaphosphingomonas haloaromaticamans]|uniref:glutathione transferase n=1 Tax=Edaphosphingomonas haloaromaticamans TaxID=653954 RepID=A0A1S1HBR6_9SPHN|nr:glutathione S-transferase family protein [Sphingomonas haloaromaticamans]OHT19679.1 hypothetical protein BHE75_01667 [Sphingomonas haloaromaticamans]